MNQGMLVHESGDANPSIEGSMKWLRVKHMKNISTPSSLLLLFFFVNLFLSFKSLIITVNKRQKQTSSEETNIILIIQDYTTNKIYIYKLFKTTQLIRYIYINYSRLHN